MAYIPNKIFISDELRLSRQHILVERLTNNLAYLRMHVLLAELEHRAHALVDRAELGQPVQETLELRIASLRRSPQSHVVIGRLERGQKRAEHRLPVHVVVAAEHGEHSEHLLAQANLGARVLEAGVEFSQESIQVVDLGMHIAAFFAVDYVHVEVIERDVAVLEVVDHEVTVRAQYWTFEFVG